MHTLLGLYVSASGMTVPFLRGTSLLTGTFYIYMITAIWQKGVFMGQLNTIGWVSSDLIRMVSKNQNSLIRFSLGEHIGYGANARTQYYQVWASGDLMRQLTRANVRKGSLIWVSGSLEQEEYTKKDGVTRDKRLNLTLKDWKYVPGTGNSENRPSRKQDAIPVSEPNLPLIETIDGERNPLPE